MLAVVGQRSPISNSLNNEIKRGPQSICSHPLQLTVPSQYSCYIASSYWSLPDKILLCVCQGTCKGSWQAVTVSFIPQYSNSAWLFFSIFLDLSLQQIVRNCRAVQLGLAGYLQPVLFICRSSARVLLFSTYTHTGLDVILQICNVNNVCLLFLYILVVQPVTCL